MSEYKLVPDEQQRIIMDLRAAIERKGKALRQIRVFNQEMRAEIEKLKPDLASLLAENARLQEAVAKGEKGRELGTALEDEE